MFVTYTVFDYGMFMTLYVLSQKKWQKQLQKTYHNFLT